MSEFKVGDRVITRWDDSLLGAMALARDTVPEGEHVIIEIRRGDARLDEPDGYWYPLRFMTKIDDAPTVEDDGGPAFPISDLSKFQYAGMSLRDYFAAKAMQGDWAAQNVEHDFQFNSDTTQDRMVLFAQMYYRMADAMLEARKK